MTESQLIRPAFWSLWLGFLLFAATADPRWLLSCAAGLWTLYVVDVFDGERIRSIPEGR